MGKVKRAVDGTVFVEHHLLLLHNANESPALTLPDNGLAGGGHGIVCIETGIHTGNVNVTINTVPAEPASLDVGNWEEIVETSAEGFGTLLFLNDEAMELPVHLSAPGSYRVRVHARGRDTAVDGTADEPFEDYYIIMWPQPPTTDQLLKATDQYGEARRRRRAAKRTSQE